MNNEYNKGKTFMSENYSDIPLPKGEYMNCIFSECVFLNADLAEIIFTSCEFEHCDLSMANLRETIFRKVKFKECKMLGLRFDHCDTFSISFQFENCMLNFSSFFKLKLKNILFANTKLNEVEFAQSDLTNAIFMNCDLDRANFQGTILENADLKSAFNFSINPETNRIKKAKFSTNNIAGLLDQYNITIE